MLRKRRYGLLLTATLLIGLAIGIAVRDDEDGPIGSTVAEFGFFAVALPDTNHWPGIINSVTLNEGRVELHQTCNVDREKIKALFSIAQAPDSILHYVESAKLSIKSKIISMFSSKVKGNNDKGVTVEIKNPKVFSISDDKLLEIKNTALKQDSCRGVIKDLIKSGAQICQTRAAIKGDLDYRISYKEGVSTETRGEIESDILSHFLMKEEEIGEDKTAGEGMFFAVTFYPRGITFNDEVEHDEVLRKQDFMPKNCPT